MTDAILIPVLCLIVSSSVRLSHGLATSCLSSNTITPDVPPQSLDILSCAPINVVASHISSVKIITFLSFRGAPESTQSPTSFFTWYASEISSPVLLKYSIAARVVSCMPCVDAYSISVSIF
jgi:hypothetical protein